MQAARPLGSCETRSRVLFRVSLVAISVVTSVKTGCSDAEAYAWLLRAEIIAPPAERCIFILLQIMQKINEHCAAA